MLARVVAILALDAAVAKTAGDCCGAVVLGALARAGPKSESETLFAGYLARQHSFLALEAAETAAEIAVSVCVTACEVTAVAISSLLAKAAVHSALINKWSTCSWRGPHCQNVTFIARNTLVDWLVQTFFNNLVAVEAIRAALEITLSTTDVIVSCRALVIVRFLAQTAIYSVV